MKALTTVIMGCLLGTMAKAGELNAYRYTDKKIIGGVVSTPSGEAEVEDSLEVIRVNETSVAFDVIISGPNFHACTASGLAKKKGKIYQWRADSGACTINLTLGKDDARVSGSECNDYCGARVKGYFAGENRFTGPKAVPARSVSCEGKVDAASRAQCVGLSLRVADDRLNKVYQEMIRVLPAGEMANVRLKQRQWLAKRDQLCGKQPACLAEQTSARAISLESDLDEAKLKAEPQAAMSCANGGDVKIAWTGSRKIAQPGEISREVLVGGKTAALSKSADGRIEIRDSGSNLVTLVPVKDETDVGDRMDGLGTLGYTVEDGLAEYKKLRETSKAKTLYMVFEVQEGPRSGEEMPQVNGFCELK